MADIDVGDVIRVDLLGDMNAVDEIVQSYQFRNVGVAIDAAAGLDDMVELMESIWAVVNGIINILTVFKRIKATNLTQVTLLGELGISPVLTGGSDSAQSPNQVTMPVSFKSDISRIVLRKHLGTTPVPAMGGAGLLTALTQTVMGNFVVHMLALHAATNSDWAYGFLSPKALQFVEPTVGVFSAVPGTQRRRRVGVGS